MVTESYSLYWINCLFDLSNRGRPWPKVYCQLHDERLSSWYSNIGLEILKYCFSGLVRMSERKQSRQHRPGGRVISGKTLAERNWIT